MPKHRLSFRQVSINIRVLTARMLLGASLLMFSSQPQAAQEQNSVSSEEKTYISWDEIKCSNPQSPDCYRELYCNLYFKFRKAGEWKSIQNCNDLLGEFDYYGKGVNGYSRYTLQMDRWTQTHAKPSTVVVSIHGLWGNANQFTEALSKTAYVAREAAPNLIELTLPGHMKDEAYRDADYLKSVREKKPFATYDRWLKALDETLELARHMGDKTIIIGQSTGGLLAAIAAIRHPEKVDEIILVEPALQVQPLINFGACLSASVPDMAINALGTLIGIAIPDGVSVKMGCEVQKLANQYFPREFIQYPRTPRSDPHLKEVFSIYERAASRIHIPVLMINNEKDKIVSAEANRHFFKGLKAPKRYVSINEDGETPHGAITYTDPTMIADLITEFSFEHLPASKIGRIHSYKTIRELQSRAFGPCDSGDSMESCKTKALESSNNTPAFLKRLKPVFLRFIPNTDEFEKLSQTLKARNDIWLLMIDRAASHGLKNAGEMYNWFKADQSNEKEMALLQEQSLTFLYDRLYADFKSGLL